MSVEMQDGEKIVIAMPKKKTFEMLKDFDVNEIKKMPSGEAIGIMTRMTASFLSNNLNGKEFSEDYVAENFDIEQMEAFITAYMDFIIEAKNNPN